MMRGVFYLCIEYIYAIEAVREYVCGSSVYLVVINFSILCMAISYALKQVCRPVSHFEIRVSVFVEL